MATTSPGPHATSNDSKATRDQKPGPTGVGVCQDTLTQSGLAAADGGDEVSQFERVARAYRRSAAAALHGNYAGSDSFPSDPISLVSGRLKKDSLATPIQFEQRAWNGQLIHTLSVEADKKITIAIPIDQKLGLEDKTVTNVLLKLIAEKRKEDPEQKVKLTTEMIVAALQREAEPGSRDAHRFLTPIVVEHSPKGAPATISLHTVTSEEVALSVYGRPHVTGDIQLDRHEWRFRRDATTPSIDSILVSPPNPLAIGPKRTPLEKLLPVATLIVSDAEASSIELSADPGVDPALKNGTLNRLARLAGSGSREPRAIALGAAENEATSSKVLYVKRIIFGESRVAGFPMNAEASRLIAAEADAKADHEIAKQARDSAAAALLALQGRFASFVRFFSKTRRENYFAAQTRADDTREIEVATALAAAKAEENRLNGMPLADLRREFAAAQAAVKKLAGQSSPAVTTAMKTFRSVKAAYEHGHTSMVEGIAAIFHKTPILVRQDGGGFSKSCDMQAALAKPFAGVSEDLRATFDALRGSDVSKFKHWVAGEEFKNVRRFARISPLQNNPTSGDDSVTITVLRDYDTRQKASITFSPILDDPGYVQVTANRVGDERKFRVAANDVGNSLITFLDRTLHIGYRTPRQMERAYGDTVTPRGYRFIDTVLPTDRGDGSRKIKGVNFIPSAFAYEPRGNLGTPSVAPASTSTSGRVGAAA